MHACNSFNSYGKKGLEIMPSKYALNQKGAIISVLFAAIWALVSMIIAIDMALHACMHLRAKRSTERSRCSNRILPGKKDENNT